MKNLVVCGALLSCAFGLAASYDQCQPLGKLCASPTCDGLSTILRDQNENNALEDPSLLTRSERIDFSDALRDDLAALILEVASLSCSHGTLGACDCCQEKASESIGVGEQDIFVKRLKKSTLSKGKS